ncbi:MAG: medium chain dehydrogenase/reductase family protein [Myxococcaceae bacterium]
MKALVITRHGGPDVLQVQEKPDPAVGPDEVAIDVAFAGLNFAEVSARVGLYPDAPPPPFVAGYEASGTIATLGANVKGLAVGDKVFGLTRFGAHASKVVIKAAQVRKVPASMSLEEAAALPVNYLTAYHMMFHVGHLRPKQRVLIHMAAGGVGLAAIQLAKGSGAELFGTASASKHALLKEAGLHHPIDYHTVDYAEEVRKITGGRGVDLVLDALGGGDWKKGYELLNAAGHIVCFGWANMVGGETRNLFKVVGEFFKQPKFAPMKLMDHNKTVSGVNLGHLWDELELLSGHLDKLIELIEAGKVKPHIDEVHPMSKAADAHRRIQSRKNVGKVLIDCRA